MTPAEQHHYDFHSRTIPLEGCGLPECRKAVRQAAREQRQHPRRVLDDTLAAAQRQGVHMTGDQLALIRGLAERVPDWADRLNGEAWERCFDALGGGKYVSETEANAVIRALLILRGEDSDER
jgi:hypothetical protein